ncbi:hypothetical protein [Thioalkalivibrio paradoxus]|uniref:ATP-grasp domain-containing protein n=1 Tax=Thioalkalivibrio paradoxus ARh 1 TaxID=713585 RepID=W0DNR1_9GAMM|nr:hypothetical protein [Thioalkalivibrio paradoxus]AHE98520.1 hypothetical protein THITH_09930 [Thioalkalivibrio paradoxus ARh 1]
MIVLLTTRTHSRTHAAVEQQTQARLRALPYERAFHALRLPRATYIFTDLDRLNFWDLELAGRLYRLLADAGLRVLNDPARVLTRFRLLRRLFERGANRFEVWRVEETREPTRYPVFLRTESAHRGALSGLLHAPDEVSAEITRALAAGIPERELLLVEFRAQPLANGIYRKLAMFRVADRMVPTLSAHQQDWHAKIGQSGVAGQALYDEEYRLLTENPYREVIRSAFDTGHTEYGRADFGIVDGRVEVYEINTNPWTAPVNEHPFPIRLETSKLFFRLYGDALREIDTGRTGSSVRLPDKRTWRQWVGDMIAGRTLRRTPRMP